VTKAKVLTQREVEAAKPKPKRYPLRDGIVPGMRCMVYPTGKKGYWLWKRVFGELVPFEVGDALLMTLGEARTKARGLLAAIANGEDPRLAKAEKVKAAGDTVEAVAESFIERHVKAHNKPRTAEEHERLIRSNILPAWGRRPITSITPRDVIELIDGIVDRGAPIAANRTFTMGRTLFNWALDRHLIESSPFARVKLPSKETSRDRTPVDFELALILRAAAKLGYPFGTFFTLRTFTGQRREEVAGWRWSELDEDLTLWTLPPSRTKNGRPHYVPIVPEVRKILLALPRFADSDFVLTTTGKTPISGYSKAQVELDSTIAELNDGVPLQPWVPHDLRRSMASTMAAAGVNLPVIEKILNHTSGSFAGIVAVYQRHEFRAEKRAALERWAKHLRSLETGDEAANIVPFELKARGV
jgi:integrase